MQAVAKIECELPILKQAFIFSALSGLRWSDVKKLLWSEIQSSGNDYYIRFRQKKRKGSETLPISKQAFDLLGERGRPDEEIFEDLKYSAWNNLKLRECVMKAVITKRSLSIVQGIPLLRYSSIWVQIFIPFQKC